MGTVRVKLRPSLFVVQVTALLAILTVWAAGTAIALPDPIVR
jgi:hypothetical protein